MEVLFLKLQKKLTKLVRNQKKTSYR